MILRLRHLVFSLTSSIIFFSISQAQGSSSCIYTEHTAANATGFVEVARLQPFIYTPPVQNSTWTISTATNEVQDFQSNSYVIEQSFWLDTNPLINTSPADLPYMGCAVLLTGFSSPQISIGTTPATNGSDSCNGVFDTDCINPEEKSASYTTPFPSPPPLGRSSGSLRPLLSFDEHPTQIGKLGGRWKPRDQASPSRPGGLDQRHGMIVLQ